MGKIIRIIAEVESQLCQITIGNVDKRVDICGVPI